MAKFKNFWAAVMVITAAMFAFVSCEGSIDELNEPSHNAGYGLMKVAAPDDKTVDVDCDNLKMRFVGDDLEDSFTHVDIYRDGGPINGKRISKSYGFFGHGSEPQFFDGLKSYDYVTTSGTVEKSSEVVEKGDWEVTLNTLLQPWNAANKAENHNFDHLAEGSVAAMVYSYYDEELGKGYAAKFPAPSVSISGKQLSNERVNGVVYNGKVYEAIKYTYAWTVTATIPEAYRMEGEKFEDTREGENVAYFLLHEVSSKVEDNTYTARFYEDGGSVVTDVQQNNFNIVTRDNGEVVDKVSYKRDLNLYVRATYLNDVEVGSEAILKSTDGRLSMGSLNSDVRNSDMFTQTTYSRTDTYTEADGQVITLNELWQKEAWGSIEFPYASIASISANTTTKRNESRCTNAQEVWTVTTVFTVKVKYNNISKSDETYSIVRSYDRIYNIPDDIVTKDENMQYVIITEVNNEKSELVATDQYNAWKTNTYNRGVLQSSEAHRVDLPLSVKTTNGSAVAIKKEQRGQKVTVRAVDEGTAKTSDEKVAGEDYTVRTSTRTATFTMSDGEKLPVTVVFGRGRKDGKDVLAYTEPKNLRVLSVETPVKNEALSSGENEVYDVKVNFAVDLEEKGSVQTRSAGDVKTEYLVANYQQTIGDEYVSERVEKIVTPSGNSVDYVVRLYETWSNRGEFVKDEKSGRLSPSLAGRNGSAIEVSNTGFTTSGNGHTGTGSGVYTNNASNGVESFGNQFDWIAPATVSVALNGTKGTRTEAISTSWSIVDAGQTIGSGSASGNYTVYPYTATVKGTYTVEGQRVTLTATANRDLKVKKPINVPDLIPGKIKSAGITCVPANGDNASNYADGANKRNAIKCLTIVSDEGAEAIPFAAWNNDNVVVPTESEITSGNFVSGNYSTAYNSGYYQNNKWIPAIAKDNSWGISYSIPSQENIRSIRNETLKQWNWRNGNYSVFVDGYNFNVDANGVLTVYYKGEVVLQCK